ncbi:Bacteriophage tail fiber assembly protein [Sodalis praecaptivus]|uniref:Bacteriophage tail fiber assembly protein n=1 Tax=Sodalis praecaptivus TaxID=1239307 RepID=W0HZH8_9GAMM|nr:tail fiber assembly protein [Sodalis praecaptivus]AHF77563.1 Bacteriophage tail fiber assembly protein [Sodalis praecaptivus]
MSYGYSAKTNTFYLIEYKEGYAEHGNWPDDVKPVSDELWNKYCVQGPAGKTRGVSIDGLPCWVDVPPPTPEEARRSAEFMKQQLMDEATRDMAPLQDAIDLDIATETEKTALLAWKKYRVQLNRVDISTAPDIDWPEEPERVA